MRTLRRRECGWEGSSRQRNIFDALEDDEEQQLLAEEDLPEDLPERPEPLPPSESQRAPAGAIPACRVWCLLVAPEHADSVAAAVAILGGSARSDAGTTCAAGGARAATELQLPSSLEAGETVLWRQRAELAELKLGQLEAPTPTHHRRLGALRRRSPPFTGDGVAQTGADAHG